MVRKCSNRNPKSQEVYCITLPKIFEKFTPLVIPAYQRGYAWDDKNIRDLINDIEDIKQFSSEEHFTGTIVLSKSKNCYLIVDGQQRLTSLFILIKAVYDKTRNTALFDKYIVKKERNDSKTRLSTQNDTNNFFEEFIVRGNLGKDVEIFSHQRIKSAKALFDDWIKDMSPSDIVSIMNIVENKLKFIIYKPRIASNASAMFEIINNRGKSLSELEKIKNYFVYIATLLGKKHTLHNKITNTWECMLKNLNKADIHTLDDENNFLRACFITFFSSSKLKYQNIYKILKNEIFTIKSFLNTQTENTQLQKLNRFLCFIELASKYYSSIVKVVNCNTAVNNLSPEINLQIKYLACQKTISSIIPLFLAIMCRDDISADTKVKLLQYLEILNFRLYVLPRVLTRSDNGVAEIYGVANKFYEKTIDAEKMVEELNNVLQTWCPINKMIEVFFLKENDKYDFANWNGLRYFLAKYEEYLENKISKTFDISSIVKARKDCQVGDYLSVEHIWARQNRVDCADEKHITKRRLGNLVLLELKPNIVNSNNDIEDKLNENNDIEDRIGIIKQTTLQQAKELSKILEKVLSKMPIYKRRGKNYYRQQGKYLADEREKRLLKFALNQWCFPDEPVKKAERLLDKLGNM